MPVFGAIGAFLGAGAAESATAVAAGVAETAAAVGTGVAVYGQQTQAAASQKMANYQASVAEREAMLSKRTAEENVRATQQQASLDTAQLNRKYAVLEGAQKAARAASGIGGGSVTEGDIATDTFRTQDLDEQMIRLNADLKSWDLTRGGELEAWGLGTQVSQYRTAGQNARIAGNINSGATILQGASTIAKPYSGYGGTAKPTYKPLKEGIMG